MISFVLYTLGAARHTELSPLRYTALTAALGWITIAAAALIAMADRSRPARRPSADVGAVTPEILYLAIPGALIAVAHVERRSGQDRAAERRR